MTGGVARIGAFHGDPDVKARLLARVRGRWAARELAPDTSLNWQTGRQPDSLSGALARTRDRAAFTAETGIPVDLAMLCEALLAAVATRVEPDAANPAAIDGTPELLAFGMEWLDAIVPGADLGSVVPRFARDCLSRMLDPGFALAPHISPGFRAVGERIAALWDRELAGEAVPRAEWREVRQAAMDADANATAIWGFRVATLLEAVAWPIGSVAGEFVGQFGLFLFSWLMHLETGQMTAQEQEDRAHLLIGWRAMAIAPRDNSGAMTDDPLEHLPESRRVTSPEHVSATMTRAAAIRSATRPAKEAVVRDLMDRLLTLIRAA